LLRKCRPPTGQEGFKIGKLNSPECHTRPSNFPEGNSSLWSAAQAADA
jgi:hypothetical protein